MTSAASHRLYGGVAGDGAGADTYQQGFRFAPAGVKPPPHPAEAHAPGTRPCPPGVAATFDVTAQRSRDARERTLCEAAARGGGEMNE